MDRIVGIETEYGCLLSEDEPHVNSELWPAKVKNYLFRKADAGTIDLHYRDYEEPPGNGGFLLNGGRLYLDMGTSSTRHRNVCICTILSRTSWLATICCNRRSLLLGQKPASRSSRTTSTITPGRRSVATRII